MSMYPSLEDMKFDQLARAQHQYQAQTVAPQVAQAYPSAPECTMLMPATGKAVMCPSLTDYTDLELSEFIIAAKMPEYNQVAIIPPRGLALPSKEGGVLYMIAPLLGQSLGLQKAQVTHGIRELVLCKDKDGKVGVRVKPTNNGVFVFLVIKQSPAALAGLRFGDQILRINGNIVAGYTMDKVHELFRKSPVNGISVVFLRQIF